MIFFQYFIFTIIALNFVFVGGLVCIIVIQEFAYKSTDFFKHKLASKWLSGTLVSFYVVLAFFVFFYVLRIYNVLQARFIDLNQVSNIIHAFLGYLPDSIIVSFYIICVLIIFGFVAFLGLLHLHKFFTHHLYMLYLYFTEKDVWSFHKLKSILFCIGNQDIITYYLFSNISTNLTIKYHAKFDSIHTAQINFEALPWYHYHKVIRTASRFCRNEEFQRQITISPLYVVLYDCALHDFVLIYSYIYLLLYVPVILLRRIIHNEFRYRSPRILDFIWQVYYGTNKELYAIPPKDKNLLDYIMINWGAEKTPNMLIIPLEISYQLVARMTFIPHRNDFMNSEGIPRYLRKMFDGRVFEINYDENDNVIIGEEWILIADKT
jgi:hypothetical protein